MELNINSPSYYSREFGVDDDIYAMCRSIRLFVRDKSYSDKVDIIGLMPTAAPECELQNGAWKEFRKIDRKAKLIIFSKRIDYEAFVNGDTRTRKRLILECLFFCTDSMPKNMDFDKETFKKDILLCTGMEF